MSKPRAPNQDHAPSSGGGQLRRCVVENKKLLPTPRGIRLPLIQGLMAGLIVLRAHESHREGRLITVGLSRPQLEFWWEAKSSSNQCCSIRNFRHEETGALRHM